MPALYTSITLPSQTLLLKTAGLPKLSSLIGSIERLIGLSIARKR